MCTFFAILYLISYDILCNNSYDQTDPNHMKPPTSKMEDRLLATNSQAMCLLRIQTGQNAPPSVEFSKDPGGQKKKNPFERF